jgi:hypothetical protein
MVPPTGLSEFRDGRMKTPWQFDIFISIIEPLAANLERFAEAR